MFEPGGPTLFELARQALSGTTEGYDLLAPKFDKTPFRTPQVLVDEVARFAGPVGSALDLCCGTGAGLQALRPYVRDRLVGVDLSEGMLAVAARNLQDHPGSATVQLVQHDALGWRGGEAFDLVVSFGAFGHILPRDERALLKTVWHALRPGGRFLFITGKNPGPTQPVWWAAQGFNAAMHVRNALIDPPFVMYYLTFLWPEVGDTLKAAGFQVIPHKGVLPPPYGHGLLVEAVKPIL